MSLEEIFAQAILTGGVTILNCSVVIGSNAQVSDFLQNTAAGTQNLKSRPGNQGGPQTQD